METYNLVEILSGEDENCLWVTFGFSSDLQEQDVLHVVCGKSVEDENRCNDTDGIYLERFDQAYSVEGGADSIHISPTVIHVGLNAKGQEALDFKGPVTFPVPKGLKGLSEAYVVFNRMHEYENYIQVEKNGKASFSQGNNFSQIAFL